MSYHTSEADCTRDDYETGTIVAVDGKSLKHGFDCDTCNNSFRRNF